MRFSRQGVRSRCAILALLTGLVAGAARADAPTFLAELNRNQIAPGEVFVYEVTLNTSGASVEAYHAPEFKGLQVVIAPQGPNQSTQMQMGPNGMFVQSSLIWHYELTATAGQRGVISIGPARARVDGRDMRSNVVSLRIGAGAAPATPATPSAGSVPGGGTATLPGSIPRGDGEPPASAAGGSFIRVVPDKLKAFVGEQVTVGWYLYLTQRQDKYETITEARTDGFWSEDVSPVNARGRLALSQEMLGGRPYQVAALFKKALFPLQPGRLTITPIESEIAQVDFFGSLTRRQRIKADPLVIEALPLPKEGQPPGFDPTSVGKFSIAARADRTAIAVGEAVTLTLDIKGQGNLHSLRPPPLPHLDGWKTYEPKMTVTLDPGELVAGSKTIEYLLLPERAVTTMFPSFELPFFDPETSAYAIARSEPLRIEVAPDAAARDRGAVAGGNAAGAHAPAGTGAIENVISAEIRPIRARAALTRDLGATFYRSRPFLGFLVVPPLALALGGLVARLRERLAQDSHRNRRRRVRQMVRQRLGAAEDHRDAGRASAFYIEIDRVLRDVLAARLRRPVSGLRMDELRDLLLQRGMPPDEAARVITLLESCDLARFAPTSDHADGVRAQMNAALERAGELIVAIDKAPLREEAPV